MGLRLVLAGLVVGLGFELPSRQDVQGWARSGRTWLCVRLDEWNAWTNLAEEPIVLGAEEPRTTPPTNASLSDAELAGLEADMAAAYGEDSLPTEPKREVAAVDQPAAAPVTEAPMPAPEPAPDRDDVAALPSDDEFDAVVDKVVECFANDLEMLAKSALKASDPGAIAAETIAPLSLEAAIELGELDEMCALREAAEVVVAADENEAEEAPEFEADIEEALAAARNWTPEPAAKPEPAPAPVSAPGDDDPYAGLAYELNRLGESVEAGEAALRSAPVPTEIVVVEEPEFAVAEPEISPLPVSRGQRLATAVRLTGEAFDAWAKLIQGPAVVSIRP